MSSRSLPRLSVGVELLARMALLGWAWEKMRRDGRGKRKRSEGARRGLAGVSNAGARAKKENSNFQHLLFMTPFPPSLQ